MRASWISVSRTWVFLKYRQGFFANLTADDFVYSALGIPGNTSNNIFKFIAIAALDVNFPDLNGLGLSIFRLDFAVGGVVPIHTHGVSELIIVIEDTIITGFIGSDGTAYYKTLKKEILWSSHSHYFTSKLTLGKIQLLHSFAWTVLTLVYNSLLVLYFPTTYPRRSFRRSPYWMIHR